MSKTSDGISEVSKLPERPIQSPNDIVRDIAERRMLAQFSSDIPPERIAPLVEHPDQIETPEEFNEAAHAHGFEAKDNVLGWSTDLESPAHIRRGEVPEEIATKVHEDLHRMTDSETLREVAASGPVKDLYEGITEYFTQEAVSDLHENVSGESYPEQTALAKALANEVGESSLRAYFFSHELSDEVREALDRAKSLPAG